MAVVTFICKYGRNIYILCDDTVSQICKEGSDVQEMGYLGCVLLLDITSRVTSKYRPCYNMVVP